ncbi:MAG: thiol-disulfide oxidoreductase ResA [Firmicutes bacterium]|uniref:Peroxiredoxin n=1 Tax=Melghirimyces thermohalophilus TaxID=1236220 RepID=A0A1G6HQ10_9BACL|nr:thiol-disulfide oxidoreductase ResA [Melghirimyces thermohalophilus]MDA8353811.1 thiol-disulfide oxidoreductase ResA [Bacillota bacterium]SDB96330.1 Peroxiredoxin [Melghirimyces thermohalophilus]
MNRKTRYWVRRILMLVMVVLVGLAIYQTMGGEGEKETAVEPGKKAPDFQLETLDGEKMKLSDLKGKVVLLNFWASWCEPCRDEMPAIQTVYDKHKDKGFEVVGVNIAETQVAVNAFARQYELKFPIAMDRERKVTEQYGIGPIPSSIFIDREGNIIRKVNGQMNEDQLENYVLKALTG